MSDPTRLEIEADVTLPTVQVEINPTGSAWVDVSGVVEGVDQTLETAGDVSGVAFGTSVGNSATVAVHIDAFSYATDLTPIRIAYGFAASSTLRRFVGTITRDRWSGSSGSWECRGVDARLEGMPIRSPLFRRRPIATATALTSIEDPTNANYRGGLFNYICWQCGGRPWEQAASYPDAPFYYRAHQALIAPEWSWINAENAWEELHRLCKAAGGQIYQDHEGVLRYVEPFSIVNPTVTFTYTDEVLNEAQRAAQHKSTFVEIARDKDLDHTVSGFSCTYVERNLDGVQQVYEDTKPKRLGASGQSDAARSFDLDVTLPVFRVSRIEVDASHIRTGSALSSAQLTTTITASSAQRVTITLTNMTSEPAQITGIRVIGRPVVAGEEGSVTFTGSSPLASTRVLPLEGGVYVQSRSHAERLVRMAYDFYATPRPVVTLSGCGYDPDRFVGERVNLTYAPWGYGNVPHRIVALRPIDGATMDVDLIPVGDLPIPSDFFEFDVDYSGSTQKQLAY